MLLVAGTALYWGVSTYEAPNIWGDEEIKTQVPEKWHTLLETYYENLEGNFKDFQLYATSNTGQYWRELKVMSNDGESSKMILACMLCNPKNSTQQKKGSLHILANTGDKLETVSRSFPMRFSHCDIVNKEQGVTKLPCEKPLDYNKEWEYLKIGNTLIYKYGVETSHCFTD